MHLSILNPMCCNEKEKLLEATVELKSGELLSGTLVPLGRAPSRLQFRPFARRTFRKFRSPFRPHRDPLRGGIGLQEFCALDLSDLGSCQREDRGTHTHPRLSPWPHVSAYRSASARWPRKCSRFDYPWRCRPNYNNHKFRRLRLKRADCQRRDSP